MRLVLENVGIIEKADIDIRGLTIIAGNNDSGKSTVGKIAYSLTKSFEDFESNYEKSKNRKIKRCALELFRLFRRDVSFLENRELRDIMDRLRLFRRLSANEILKLVNQLKELLDEKSIKMNKKLKEEVSTYIREINSLFEETDSNNSKILKSIKEIFASEFRNQINSIFTNESKISVIDGKNTIINMTVKDNEILNSSSERIDEIFPFDSSIFVETPFVLTYKEALEYSDDIYHVNDLLSRLETPPGIHNNDSLDITNIIGGEICYDDEEDNFSFKKNVNGKKIKIDILNSASGIKSLGILQLLDKAGEFNKNLLLVIDEPEVHLHPDWQVEYAKLLIQLVKKGVNILITSHSPYLIEALNKFSSDEGLRDVTKFYLSKSNGEGKAIIIDKTEDKEEIFDKLSKPFERLIFGE